VKSVKTLDDFIKIEVAEKIPKEAIVQETHDLHDEWRWVKLKEILKEDRQSINPHEYSDKEFFLVTMDCIESNTGKLLKKVKCLGKEIRSMKYKFDTRHVLYGKLRPYLNKVYVPEEEGICTTEFIPFIVTKALREYVAYYLRRKETVNFAMSHITGTRQPRVIIDIFLEYPIPLPALEEQKRIVSRLEQLISRAEEARRLRKLAKEEADKIMQAALNKVFSRAKEEEWEWAKLGTLLIKKPQYGLTARSSQEKKEVRYIRISDVNDHGELKDDDPRFLDLTSEEYEKYKVEENDILIARSGSVGRVYLHRPIKQKCVFASYLIRFKLDSNKLLPKFFFYFGLSSLYREFVENTLRKVAQPNINAKEYCKLEVPLLPLKEQEKIVAYLDRINGIRKIVSGIQQKTEEELEKLIPSILDKAFRGGL
jgi:type I restriction enzyme S subunit